jgi:hypothetical protein
MLKIEFGFSRGGMGFVPLPSFSAACFALIEVQIDVDDSGDAISHPKVDVGYTGCL